MYTLILILTYLSRAAPAVPTPGLHPQEGRRRLVRKHRDVFKDPAKTSACDQSKDKPFNRSKATIQGRP